MLIEKQIVLEMSPYLVSTIILLSEYLPFLLSSISLHISVSLPAIHGAWTDQCTLYRQHHVGMGYGVWGMGYAIHTCVRLIHVHHIHAQGIIYIRSIT